MNANQMENVMEIDHKEETMSCDMIPSTFLESTSSTISLSCHEESIESAQSLAENTEQKLQHLQAKYDSLQKKYHSDIKAMENKLFRMERFIGSDHDFKFYTGFPDYTTFKVFFDYLSLACNTLIYHGSDTGILHSAEKRVW